jgi:hypothetical protein
MTADRSAGSDNGSLASFPPVAALRPASEDAGTPGATFAESFGASRAIAPPPDTEACTAAFPPPDAPPLLAADPLPEQPAAAPARPETTIIVAGTHMNRRTLLIETSVVVDGETGVGCVWFPTPVAGLRRIFAIPASQERNYT